MAVWRCLVDAGEPRTHRKAPERVADARDRAEPAARLRQGRADRKERAQERALAEGVRAAARPADCRAVRRARQTGEDARARRRLTT